MCGITTGSSKTNDAHDLRYIVHHFKKNTQIPNTLQIQVIVNTDLSDSILNHSEQLNQNIDVPSTVKYIPCLIKTKTM